MIEQDILPKIAKLAYKTEGSEVFGFSFEKLSRRDLLGLVVYLSESYMNKIIDTQQK